MDIASSITTLYDLPMEMLDVILQKSYILMSLNSERKQINTDVTRYLASVDVCFSQRIARRRFKKVICRLLGDMYEKTKKSSAIIRNNRKYLLENIQPNDELMESLLSLNCITKDESQFIQRQRSRRDKNAELLLVLRSVDETKILNFVKCLRQTNQTDVARIIENGGVVIKVKVRNRGKTPETSKNLEEFSQMIGDIRQKTRLRLYEVQIDMIIHNSQVMDENIEILNCKLDRKTVVISTWCRSQAAVQFLERLFEANRLMGSDFTDSQTWFYKSLHPILIISSGNRFNKTVGVGSIYVKSTERFQVEGTKEVNGVAKLRNEIYIICRISSLSLIRVFEDRNPFRLQRKIVTKEFKYPVDIVSSEKENCLYVSDNGESCIWKITRESDDQFKIIKWLTTIFDTSNLSMSSDGQLLVVSAPLPILRIYGSNAELIRFIRMPIDVEELRYAVKTSMGNFIILHQWMESEEERRSSPIIEGWMESEEERGSSPIFEDSMESEEERGSSSQRRKTVMKSVVSELSKDGQTIIRRFVPSDKSQILNDPRCLALDGCDQVFVADSGKSRVIVLDSGLKWDKLFCSASEVGIWLPNSLCYDEDKKQLIVVGADFYSGCIANVYTFKRQ